MPHLANWKRYGKAMAVELGPRSGYKRQWYSARCYVAQRLSMTVANGRKLDAAHNKWLRRILHVSWSDKITNKEIWEWTGHKDIWETS